MSTRNMPKSREYSTTQYPQKPLARSPLEQPDLQGDRGVTLVELMMVIAITSIVGALVMGTLVVMGNLATKTTEQTEDFVQARTAIEEIAVNLRGANNKVPANGLLNEATGTSLVFYTRSGDGLLKDPQLIKYQVNGGRLQRVLPGKGDNLTKPASVRTMLQGIENSEVFEFYTWVDPKNPQGQKCFRKLSDGELNHREIDPTTGKATVGFHARNAIAGVKIKIELRDGRNVRFKDRQPHTTWVRLGESIEPKDPTTGALIEGWPKQCWEVFDE